MSWVPPSTLPSSYYQSYDTSLCFSCCPCRSCYACASADASAAEPLNALLALVNSSQPVVGLMEARDASGRNLRVQLLNGLSAVTPATEP